MLDWSFGLLSADEQRVLARLSVFAGSFTLAAAHAVAADTDGTPQTVTNAIAGLVDKSLVCVSPTDGQACYRLLDTTRAYAVARLVQSGEADTAAGRHAAFLAAGVEGPGSQKSAVHMGTWNPGPHRRAPTSRRLSLAS